MTRHQLQPPPKEAPAWVHRAWASIIRDSTSITAAAKAQGKHPSSLRNYIVVGDKEANVAKVKAWRDKNLEHARALGRDSVARAIERDEKGYRRMVSKSSKKHRRKPEYRGKCTNCGESMGIGTENDGTCMKCRTEVKEKRFALIASLWQEGKSMAEIAKRMGISKDSLGRTMNTIRAEGKHPLPHRYQRTSLR